MNFNFTWVLSNYSQFLVLILVHDVLDHYILLLSPKERIRVESVILARLEKRHLNIVVIRITNQKVNYHFLGGLIVSQKRES